MTLIRSTLIALALAATAAGCHDEGDSSGQSAVQETNRTNAELQKTIGQERDGRVQVEAALAQQQAATTWWQSAATLLSVAAIALLIVGTIVGSAARHESER